MDSGGDCWQHVRPVKGILHSYCQEVIKKVAELSETF